MTHSIGFLVYPGFELLDLSGPLAVFNDTNDLAVPGAYAWTVLSVTGGMVASSAGVEIATQAAAGQVFDTIVIPGGAARVVREPPAEVVACLLDMAGRARRISSSCTGAYFMAEAGLLDGRRATTHWRFAAELQVRCPASRIDADKIYIRDGDIWTSAGVTAGIDLALALVEDDLGPAAAREVARGLVVYHRRLGGQSQYSALLDLDAPSDRVRKALAFARDHLHEILPVARLAAAAHLSERQFARAFVAATGISPAKAVERMRVETARPMLDDSRTPLEEIARSVGFTDPDHMREAFIRFYGQAPQALRRTSRTGASTAMI
jgi:transcriptional regulator GlxA family with amidase domain